MATDKQILSNLVKRMKAREADPLRPLIDAYLLKRDQSPTRYRAHEIDMKPRVRPGGRLSPSSLGGCQRQAQLKFLGVPGRRRVDPDLALVFDDGDWRHHKWQATFRDMEAVLGRDRIRVLSIEQSVQFTDLYIAGNLDAVLWLKPWPNKPGKRWVIDIKGINDVGFQRILQNDAPIAHHVGQLVSYEAARDVPRGLLFYENKNNQLTRSYIVNFTDAEWENVQIWATQIIKALERKRLLPMHPDCDAGSYDYEKCPYSGLCYGRKDSEDIRELAYQDFTTVIDAWRAGKRALRSAS